ncbi:MAG TPA: hypothetical protein VKT72_18000 [Candidatus Baltobacteraceae bacterium]|nr:hypothetical protein [Candidatus Baltobacteraceae bacterium]
MQFLALFLALVVPPGHAFDYQFGTWSVHASRLTRNASGSTKWVTYDGTHTVTPLWHGRANIGVLEIHGAAGTIEGMQLRLFNPATGRWKLSFASSTDGELQPPSIGSFHGNVGDFRSTDDVDGKRAVVRTLSTISSPTSYRDVIARSYDNGKTWAPVWIATYEKQVAHAPPDGAHDFDFDFGTWHTRIRRLVHPLSGSNAWVTYDGTVTVRTALGGAANVEEIEANGPGHLELLNVRLYNKASRQWSLNGASSADGTLETAMFGGFEHGRGVFYNQETYNGRTILDRQTFFDITPTSYSFEQAFSDDGGKTWEPNFVANLTRTSLSAPSEASQTVENTSHDFDFSYGTWSTHIKSYETAGDNADAPTSYIGTVAWRKIWGGRAFLEEIKASNESGGFAGLTLFLYNPQARQWSQTFAGSGSGTFDPSMVGTFKNGRGELVSFPVADGGAYVLTREVWSDIHPNTHHFEIQYSRDGGKTWQASFIANLARIGPGL